MMFSYLGQRWRGEAYVGVVLKMRRLLELILIKRMFGQYGDEKGKKELPGTRN